MSYIIGTKGLFLPVMSAPSQARPGGEQSVINAGVQGGMGARLHTCRACGLLLEGQPLGQIMSDPCFESRTTVC